MNQEDAPGYMVDTNVFDTILDGALSIDTIGGPLYSTSIQRTELEAIPDENRRVLLLAAFRTTTRLNTPAAVWDVSTWGEANFGTEEQNKFVETFAAELQSMDRRSNKRPKDPLKNSVRDALIAITARDHNLVLVTFDKNLELLANRRGIVTRLLSLY